MASSGGARVGLHPRLQRNADGIAEAKREVHGRVTPGKPLADLLTVNPKLLGEGRRRAAPTPLDVLREQTVTAGGTHAPKGAINWGQRQMGATKPLQAEPAPATDLPVESGMKGVGARIKEMREARGWSGRELARQADLQASRGDLLRRAEATGRYLPSAIQAVRYIRAVLAGLVEYKIRGPLEFPCVHKASSHPWVAGASGIARIPHPATLLHAPN